MSVKAKKNCLVKFTNTIHSDTACRIFAARGDLHIPGGGPLTYNGATHAR